jgi:hypothetical protein
VPERCAACDAFEPKLDEPAATNDALMRRRTTKGCRQIEHGRMPTTTRLLSMSSIRRPRSRMRQLTGPAVSPAREGPAAAVVDRIIRRMRRASPP